MKKIIITGATGAIGQRLVMKLFAGGNKITVFTRDPAKAKKIISEPVEFIEWDYDYPEKWKYFLEQKDAVVHLAGINLSSKRWNEKFKQLAYKSRVDSTKFLVEAIKTTEAKPKAFICASGVGIYGSHSEELLTEDSKPADDFLAMLCKDWETEAARVENSGVRRVSIRTGVGLSPGEGLMKKFTLQFKLFAGGPLGNGNQWFPWIHIDDIAGIYLHGIFNESIEGPLNAASPGIVRMKEFARVFGKVINRPSLFPVPEFILKLIAGELGERATDSQNISVDKLLRSGYKFKFENLEEALSDLLK